MASNGPFFSTFGHCMLLKLLFCVVLYRIAGERLSGMAEKEPFGFVRSPSQPGAEARTMDIGETHRLLSWQLLTIAASMWKSRLTKLRCFWRWVQVGKFSWVQGQPGPGSRSRVTGCSNQGWLRSHFHRSLHNCTACIPRTAELPREDFWARRLRSWERGKGAQSLKQEGCPALPELHLQCSGQPGHLYLSRFYWRKTLTFVWSLHVSVLGQGVSEAKKDGSVFWWCTLYSTMFWWNSCVTSIIAVKPSVLLCVVQSRCVKTLKSRVQGTAQKAEEWRQGREGEGRVQLDVFGHPVPRHRGQNSRASPTHFKPVRSNSLATPM